MADTELTAPLTNWMCGQLPDAVELELSGFAAPAAGASNETQLFTASWRDKGITQEQLYVLRMTPRGAPVFAEYDLHGQYRAMSLLQDTEVPVPELLAYEADASILGSPFYVMRGIPGRVVAEQPPYYLDGWFTQASEEERRAIFTSGITAAAKVNRQNWRALGFNYLLPEGQTPLQQQIDEYTDFLRWTEKKGQPYPSLWALRDWLLANQPEDEPVALCWGDAKVSNLLFDDQGDVTAVLDWEMVHLGNPVDDLAWWMTLDNSMSEGLCRLVCMEVPRLPGVLSKEEMLKLWEQESGFSARELDYYEVLGAFRFGIIMASVSINLMNEGIMPREMEMDINNTCTPLLDRLLATHRIPLPDGS